MGIFQDAFLLKDILKKASPSIDDVQKVTRECLDSFCVSFLRTRFINRHDVIPSIVRAGQAFCGLPESDYKHSKIVYRSTLRNLDNVINTWVTSWPQLDKNAVIEATKKGVQEWIEIVERDQ